MTQFTITTDDRAIQSALTEAASRIVDLTPVMQSIGEYFLLRTRSRFDTETAPGGARWAVLAEATVRAKQRRIDSAGYKNGRSRARSRSPSATAILKDTYLLRDTINYQASPAFVRVGTPQRYGVFHQYGTRRMPARPFLGIDDRDVAEIRSIVLDALQS